jgi:hypothetical protein
LTDLNADFKDSLFEFATNNDQNLLGEILKFSLFFKNEAKAALVPNKPFYTVK